MATHRNKFRRRETVYDTSENIDTDADGQFTHTFGGLRSIAGPECVEASAEGGYVANCVSVDGNVATFEVYYGGGAGAGLDLVTGTDDVANVNLRASGQ